MYEVYSIKYTIPFDRPSSSIHTFVIDRPTEWCIINQWLMMHLSEVDVLCMRTYNLKEHDKQFWGLWATIT